ncbi:MAG: hypothetical protein IMZ65_01530 [Planctomycetes bacterium]|nr:hypothetical protein [Planctomycetota bacterium]
MSTRCRTNLGRIFKAQNAWRANEGGGSFAIGAGWPSMLAPYLDESGEVTRCPAAPARLEETASTTPGGTPGATRPPTGITTSDLTFRMYARKTWSVYTNGQYLGTAFIDSGYGIEKRSLGSGGWYYGIDDRSFFLDKSAGGGNLDYKDMRFNLWMEGHFVDRIDILGSDEITSDQTSYEKFRFEIWVVDEIISDDFYREKGRTLEMPSFIKSFDYALNKGMYEVDGARVSANDSSLILILDYAKSVADYASKNPDVWDKYFQTDEATWMTKHGHELAEGETWRHYLAARHGGEANVLFCDGHVETLTPDNLQEKAPMWRFGPVKW